MNLQVIQPPQTCEQASLVLRFPLTPGSKAKVAIYEQTQHKLRQCVAKQPSLEGLSTFFSGLRVDILVVGVWSSCILGCI